MVAGGIVQAVLGLKTEQMSLEDIAKPLTAQEAEDVEEGDAGAATQPGTQSAKRRCYRRALGLAQEQGAIRRTGRDRYALPEDGGAPLARAGGSVPSSRT